MMRPTMRPVMRPVMRPMTRSAPSTVRWRPVVSLGAALAMTCVLGGCASSGDQRCYEQSVAELRVCAGASTVSGVDVSTYQGVVDWAAVKASGRAFAIARVSDGTRTLDNQFARNWRGIKAAGLVRGVYQYFRPGQDAVAQADLVITQVNAAGGFDAADLPVVLDLETADGQSTATVRARAQAWLDRIEARTGSKPIVYTAAFMTATIGNGFVSYPLWVANYGVACPSMPSNWTEWRFWQSGSTGRVPGISGNVDVDVFNGTLAQLRAFAGVVPPPADGGMSHPDGGITRPDGGVTRPDGGVTPADGGGARPDGGVGRPDAGLADAGLHDAGLHDAGLRDAGLGDGGPELSDAGSSMPDAGLDEPDGGGQGRDAGIAVDGGQGAASGQGAQSGDACR